MSMSSAIVRSIHPCRVEQDEHLMTILFFASSSIMISWSRHSALQTAKSVSYHSAEETPLLTILLPEHGDIGFDELSSLAMIMATPQNKTGRLPHTTLLQRSTRIHASRLPIPSSSTCHPHRRVPLPQFVAVQPRPVERQQGRRSRAQAGAGGGGAQEGTWRGATSSEVGEGGGGHVFPNPS